MPDILQDRGPRGNTDPGTNQNSDFVLEDVFGRGTIWPIDAELGHHLPVLQGYFVHAHWVEAFQIRGLRWAAAECVSEGASEVADLADVDADVRVEGAGGDSEGVPLCAGDVRDLKKDPLSRLILHSWLAKLDFHGVCRWRLAHVWLGELVDVPYGCRMTLVITVSCRDRISR